MRIVWTRDEKRAMRECMIDLCYVTPSLSNIGLLQHAQEEVIPYERRVKVNHQRVFNYKKLINEARAAADQLRQAEAKKPVEALKKPEPPAEPPARKLDTLGEVFELFVDALADRIIRRLEARPLAARPDEPREHKLEDFFGGDPMEQLDRVFDSLYPPLKKAPIQPRKPTVLVIGLNGHQMECIKQSRPEIDFTFVTGEQGLSHQTLNKDHTILMTKFINHSVQAKYRKHPNLHYCNGGVSELKHMLQIIFHKEYA